jgi:hypothetical protein
LSHINRGQCIEAGCKRVAKYASGLCYPCTYPEAASKQPECRVEKCSNRAPYSDEYCNTHHRQFVASGDPLFKPTKRSFDEIANEYPIVRAGEQELSEKMSDDVMAAIVHDLLRLGWPEDANGKSGKRALPDEELFGWHSDVSDHPAAR